MAAFWVIAAHSANALFYKYKCLIVNVVFPTSVFGVGISFCLRLFLAIAYLYLFIHSFTLFTWPFVFHKYIYSGHKKYVTFLVLWGQRDFSEKSEISDQLRYFFLNIFHRLALFGYTRLCLDSPVENFKIAVIFFWLHVVRFKVPSRGLSNPHSH